MAISIGTNTMDQLIESVQKLNPEQRKTLVDKLQETSMADVRASAETKRLGKMQAAIDAESPVIPYAQGALRRIGLDFVQAADLNRLISAMTAAKMDGTRRIELKKILADLGVID